MDVDDFNFLDQFYEDSTEAAESLEDDSLNKLDRYKDPEKIASGGMKEIYKAYDSKSQRHVALARLRKDVPEEHCEDFLNEAYRTAALEHPNIISVYDIGVATDGSPFFTMELKIGDNLAKILRKRKEGDESYLQSFPLQKKLEIYLKVCDAIAYAHANEILHLDIKPDNIQVGKFGEVQVCDWGLGSHLNKVNMNIDEEVLKGTPGFMAPEQIMQNLGKGYVTDIYALGVLLYTVLTDTEPGEGGLKTIIDKTISGEILALDFENDAAQIPKSLKAVVEKAISVEKEHRYESVEQLKKEVEYYLSGRSTAAEEASFVKEFSLFYKRNIPVCTAIFVALVIILAGSSYFLLKLKKSNKEIQSAYKQVNEALEDSERNSQLYRDKVKAERKLTNSILKDDFKDEVLKLQAPLYFIHSSRQIELTVSRLLTNYKVAKNKYSIADICVALFLCQRFNELLEILGDEKHELKLLASKFSALPKDELGLLGKNDFLMLLQDINEGSESFRLKYVERLVTYYQRKASISYVRTDVVKELIRSLNPDWDTKNFHYDSKKLSLKISGANLKYLKGGSKLSSNQTILRFLKIDSLDLRGTSIAGVSQLDRANIRELDIRETDVKDLKNIRKLKNLTKVIITQAQVPQEELNRALPWVKVEEK